MPATFPLALATLIALAAGIQLNTWWVVLAGTVLLSRLVWELTAEPTCPSS